MPESLNDFIGGVIFHKRAKEVMEEMNSGESLVVDLNNLWVDSSIIGTLLAILTSCQKKGIKFYIENMSPETRKVIEVTGLGNLLVDHETRQEEKD